MIGEDMESASIESNSVVVRTNNLTRKFGEVRAVNKLTLAIGQGEIFGLVGPDGAGKTTTLRLLCGLLDPTEGEVLVAGYDVTRHGDAVRDRIGYMAQRFGLYGDLTVEENIIFYADLFGIHKKALNQSMTNLLRMTRMEPFRKRQARKLSGGMKQKLALICTLLHRPHILFLDEPTNGVDPVSRRDFWAIIYQLVKEGMTVLVTTAYMDEAERCNRVGMMHKGALIHCDSPKAIRDNLQEVCYELQCSDLRQAREILSHQEGILSVEPSGAFLHLFLSPMLTPKDSVTDILREKGLESIVIREITPSLEDVFIAIMRKVSLENAE